MPYIPQQYRMDAASAPTNPGELNFAITSLIMRYLGALGGHYSEMNDVLGALEGAKQEFYRRVVAPYEDRKREENGDVY